MRRFDGHGSSNYRPTNPEAARQMNSAMEQMLAERQRQDAGLFTTEGQELSTTEKKAEPSAIIKLYTKPASTSTTVANSKPEECYSLSS